MVLSLILNSKPVIDLGYPKLAKKSSVLNTIIAVANISFQYIKDESTFFS